MKGGPSPFQPKVEHRVPSLQRPSASAAAVGARLIRFREHDPTVTAKLFQDKKYPHVMVRLAGELQESLRKSR